MNIIKTLIDAIGDELGIEPKPFSSRLLSQLPAITYTAYPQRDNAIVESWRLQTRVTAETLEEAIDIEGSMRELLCTLGDEEKLGSLSIEVNGGGALEDEATGYPQLLTYYDVNTKS